MRYGLVLEGGAMRGMFTAGVLDVFMENEIEFDGAVGTSAGAVFGCNYKSCQPRRAIRYNLRFGRDYRYGSFLNLLLTGNYYGKDFAYNKIPFELDPFDHETYMRNPMEFYVCATDVETGEAIYFKSETGDERDIEWMRGSASMPLFSKVVEVDGFKLLDGGIADSVPIRFMEDEGFEKNVVILTQPDGYIKKPNKLVPVMKRALSKYPKVAEKMSHRHEDYNDEMLYIKEREMEGVALVIRPDEPLDISRIEKNPDELKRVYKIGRKKGKEMLPRVRDFLSK